ncbi:hypothetical protein ABIF68_000080 [Bradyrhizobium japonicum]
MHMAQMGAGRADTPVEGAPLDRLLKADETARPFTKRKAAHDTVWATPHPDSSP